MNRTATAIRKDLTMTPVARAVLDSTTDALSKARAENKQLRKIVDDFLSSPRGRQMQKTALVRRDVNAALLPNGALSGTRSTRTTHTPESIERIRKQAEAIITARKAAATVKPVCIGGAIDPIATAIKRMHATGKRP